MVTYVYASTIKPLMSTTTMRVTLQSTTIIDHPTFANLMQLYLHDISEAEARDVNPQGLFSYSALEHYWQDANCCAFLIHADEQLAGFVLVHGHSRIHAVFNGRVVAEFFVLRRYRRQGIGRAAATKLFARFAGTWEIAIGTTNVPAQCFWRSVLQEYTAGQYHEAWHHQHSWYGYIQTFVTPDSPNS